LFSLHSFGQKTEKDVFTTKTITFYGYDFTHFKLADAAKINDPDVKEYIPYAVGYCVKYINEEKLRNWLYKNVVSFNLKTTEEFIRNENTGDFVTISRPTLPKDSIQKMINVYPVTEKQGIGFLVICECFDNNTNRVSTYFTFFDIATKKVLMVDYFVVGSQIRAYRKVSKKYFWATLLEKSFAQYAGLIYRKRAKAYEVLSK
jgi:hypothetical protein